MDKNAKKYEAYRLVQAIPKPFWLDFLSTSIQEKKGVAL